MLQGRSPLLFAITCAAVAKAGYVVETSWADDAGWHCTLALSEAAGTAAVNSPDVRRLRVDAVIETPTRLHVAIDDLNRTRFRVPAAVLPAPRPMREPRSLTTDGASAGGAAAGSHIAFQMHTSDPFSFLAMRGSTALFNSSVASLIYKDQFISLATAVPPDAKIFGLMESTRHQLFMQPGETRTMWAADKASAEFGVNTYGSHPFFVSVSADGAAHGVLMLNSNGIDVSLSEDASRLSYGLIGGVVSLYIFSGPSVADVVAQYSEAVGRAAMMPRWALGFHNCRWGYRSLEVLEAVTANYSEAKIPITTFWMDIEYMHGYRDFTTDPLAFPAGDFSAYVDRLHAKDNRFVVILDPGIMIDPGYKAYLEGLEADVFVRDGFTGAYYTGVVWPGAVHYPDFLHPNTSAWWKRQILDFLSVLPVDGLWVDMNEASTFCNEDGRAQECHLADAAEAASCWGTNGGQCCVGTDGRVVVCRLIDPANPLDFPPHGIHNVYSSDGSPQPLGRKTLPPSALHYGGVREYDVHSTYGSLMAKATARALGALRPERRPFVLSRSTFVGHGAYAAHWLGDNGATWADLRASVRGILSFSMLGMPMVGSDICGFSGDTTEELCGRWVQVGAFAPFSRVHNAIHQLPQELYRWESVARSARAALSLRYQLLPYLYTLFYEAHKRGSMVTRPLFAVFPGDAEAFAVMDRQYMLGDALLFTPVLTPNTTHVRGYFPRGYWHSLVDGQPDVHATAAGHTAELETPLERTNVHLRAGRVLPLQPEPDSTRVEALHLLVALDEHGHSQGSVFLDDGEQPAVGRDAVVLRVTASRVASAGLTSGRLELRGVGHGTGSWSVPRISSVRILGVERLSPGWAFASVPEVGKYDQASASITFPSLGLPANGTYNLSWTLQRLQPSIVRNFRSAAAKRLPGRSFASVGALHLGLLFLSGVACTLDRGVQTA